MPGHVHAALGAVDPDAAKVSPQLVEQAVAAREVPPSNPVKVPLEAAAVQELGDRGLLEPRVAVVEKGLGADGRRRERRREDDIAEAKRRADRLGERAQVDGGLGAIERIEGEERGLLVSKVAVVVVFDDVGARPRRPVEQREAARERQRRPQRKLVRRRHVGESRLAGKPVDAEPFVVHRGGRRAAPRSWRERAPRPRNKGSPRRPGRPGVTRTRATRFSPSWQPATMTIWSASARIPRASRRWSEMATRSSRRPAGSP